MMKNRPDRDPIVNVRDLSVSLKTRQGDVQAVDRVSFSLAKGEVLGFLGESGSGKSLTLRALMRLLPPNADMRGYVNVSGQDVLMLSETEMQSLRGPVLSMVFQEPLTALDPVFTIGHQIAEMILRHEGGSRESAMRRAGELLDIVRIPSPKLRLRSYPHELSGGMRQRAMIALALSCNPQVLLADEPTTALDVTVQMQILLLLRELQAALGMAVIFVTHDIGVAAEIADRLAVMRQGSIVESGSTVDVIERPAHPYTRDLLNSILVAGRPRRFERLPNHNPQDPNSKEEG